MSETDERIEETEAEEQGMHPLLLTFLVWLQCVLSLLEIYGYAVAAGTMSSGIISGYITLFSAMTISGAVLCRYLVERVLSDCAPETDLRYAFPGAVTVCILLSLLEKSGGLSISLFALIVWSIFLFLQKKKKNFRNMEIAAGAVLLTGSILLGIRSVMLEAGMDTGIFFAMGGFLLAMPFWKHAEIVPGQNVLFTAAFSAGEILLPAGMVYCASQSMRIALDETALYRFSSRETIVIAGGAVLALVLCLSGSHRAEADSRSQKISAALAGAAAALGVFYLDPVCGLADLFLMLAVNGALVYLHAIRGGDGGRMLALRHMLAGLLNLAVVFISLYRYNGTSFNLRDLLGVWMILLACSEMMQLQNREDIVYEEEEPDHE